jgi:hypothetical protein
LLSLVYEELRRLAAAKMASEAPGHTLQATALVMKRGSGSPMPKTASGTTEPISSLRLLKPCAAFWWTTPGANEPCVTAGGQQRVEMPQIAVPGLENDDKVLAVNEALEKFAALDSQKAELVKLRYFVGMTLEQAAEALGISERTAKRYWAFARAWLHEEIKTQPR